MKTVGLITMHRPDNYGSYLQTVATCKFIEKLGYKPVVIDYCYPNLYHINLRKEEVSSSNQPRKKSFLVRKISGLCRRFLRVDRDKHLSKMASFYERNITLSRAYETAKDLITDPPLFDIYLTGSDQVWNPKFIGHDTTFLLSWAPDNKKRIAYASSFAIKEIPSAYKSDFSKYLNKYDSIGVRERSHILEDLINRETNVVLDPTFLFDLQGWEGIVEESTPIKDKYILCYLLGYNFDPYPYAYELIEKVKSETGYKVVMIDSDPINILRGYKVVCNIGPDEFVNLFKNASYVITSSFHGTAFAVNFEKPFFTIVDDNRNNKDNRQVSLLQELGVSVERCVSKNTPLDRVHVDENVVWHNSLEMRRSVSKDYFIKALGGYGQK